MRAVRPLTRTEQKSLSKWLDESQFYWTCPEEPITLEDADDMYDGLLLVIEETSLGIFVIHWCGESCTYMSVWYGRYAENVRYSEDGIKWTTVMKNCSMDRYDNNPLED